MFFNLNFDTMGHNQSSEKLCENGLIAGERLLGVVAESMEGLGRRNQERVVLGRVHGSPEVAVLEQVDNSRVIRRIRCNVLKTF